MHSRFLDAYSQLDSPIRRLPARLKLAVALAGLIGTVVLPISYAAYFILWGSFLVGVAVASKIPAAFLLKRLVLLEPLVLGVALLAWFQPHGGTKFLVVVVKSTLCLLTMILLSNTTPFAELLKVLRGLRVPPLLITTLALMNRYLYVLADEAERMKRARASRTFARRSRLHVWNSVAMLAGQLFVRSTERAERIYAAMCARGWR
jgi:cobalt/nickel transport system permease protein